MASLYTRRLSTRLLLSRTSPADCHSPIFSSQPFFSLRGFINNHFSETTIPSSPNKFPAYSDQNNSSPLRQTFQNPTNFFIWRRRSSVGQIPIIPTCSYATSLIGTRYLSSPSGDSEAQNPPKTEHPTCETVGSFKHQEIQGPTVERDLSPLANETREVLDKLRRNVYDLSNAVALLGIAQLICGAWVSWITRPGIIPEASIQGLAAFAFPFSMAFLLRQTAKPMGFFRKMEEMGRLQILTLAMQTTKSVDLLIRRILVMSLFCGSSLLIGLLLAAWSH